MNQIDTKWLSLPLLCFLSACASVPAAKSTDNFTQLPQELSAVDWTRTPEDVLKSPIKGEPLVWVGQVREVSLSQKESKIEILWLCKHLRFVEPGPAAIAKRPIKVKEGSGSFAVSLVAYTMPIEKARELQKEQTRFPHYLLAGGTFHSFIESHGTKVVLLYPYRMGIGPKLAEFAK